MTKLNNNNHKKGAKASKPPKTSNSKFNSKFNHIRQPTIFEGNYTQGVPDSSWNITLSKETKTNANGGRILQNNGIFNEDLGLGRPSYQRKWPSNCHLHQFC